MNRPIFTREDFILCDVPVPNAYPQSQTHAGVALCNGLYYLTTTPYPVVSRSKWLSRLRHVIRMISHERICGDIPAETYENPCLYRGGNDKDNPPTVFALMQQTPLFNTPEQFYDYPSYNSDPDIFIDDGDIFILNRSVIRISELCYRVRIYLMHGVDERGRFKMLSNYLFFESKERCLSPCITKINNKYILTYIDSNSAIDAESFSGIYIRELDNLLPMADSMLPKQVEVNGSLMLPWHMSLFQYEGGLFTIIACVEKGEKGKIWQMLGEFNSSLTALHIYKTPLTDYNSYRGSACVTESGIFVLYSTTVHETLTGSNAVDGRNVIMAKMKFDSLLYIIRQRETQK